jgi:hypothetical protein
MKISTNHLVEGKKQRDLIEEALMKHFPDIVRPLTFRDIEIINQFKDGSFGFSFLGLMLYANGYNLRGESSRYPQGLLYYDGENIFGLGFFKKTFEEEKGHLHIIAPRGKTWITVVNNFIKQVRQILEIPKTSIYIRHLSETKYRQLMDIRSGFSEIKDDPWHPFAHSEDETYHHRLILLDEVITYDNTGSLVIKILEGEESRDFRRKAKLAYNRFKNFLHRNHIEFCIEPYHPDKQKHEAKNLIIRHFKTLKNAVGSSPEDYFNLVYHLPSFDQGNRDFFAYMGYLRNENDRIPIMLFIGEKVNSDTVALYATFALRDDQIISPKYDPTGFTAISQYSYLRIFDLLHKNGIRYVDLGGSEVEDLDRFKRQLGAKEVRTYWLVVT